MTVFRWKDVEPTVVSLLKDEAPSGSERNRRYATGDLIVWWNNAQVQLASLKPRVQRQVYKDDGLSVHLPDLHYKPVGVWLPGHPQSLPRMGIVESSFSTSRLAFYVYGDSLTLTGLNSAPIFTYLYQSYYPRVKDDDSRIEVPEWAIEACAIYVAIQAVTKESMADARYRKFAQAQDAGNPTHNPFLPVAKWLESRWYNILNSHSDDDPDA